MLGYDIIVGIPSYNEEENISFVAGQVDRGLDKYFGNKRALIVNCDGNSGDRTVEVFLSTRTKADKVVLRKKNADGKGAVFKELFKFIKKNKAKYCIVLDADLRSITPEWIKYMLEPLAKRYDFVTPSYSRHKYDGTITDHLCFPLVYGLLNKNIRQPIGGDFAFSGKMAEYWLKQKWIESTEFFGIDIFMTLNAIKGGFKIDGVNLGTKKHRSRIPRSSSMFSQVADSLLFNLRQSKIGTGMKPENPKIFGLKKTKRPQSLIFDKNKIKKSVLEEYRKHSRKMVGVLTEDNLKTVQEGFDKGDVALGPDLWSRIVYDCMWSYGRRRLDSINTLQVLHLARTFSFIKQTERMSQQRAEREILKQAKIFRKNRDYFLLKC